MQVVLLGSALCVYVFHADSGFSNSFLLHLTPQIPLDAPPAHVDAANHIPLAEIDPKALYTTPKATPPSHVLREDTPLKATPPEEGPVDTHIHSKGKCVCVCALVLLVCCRSIFQRLVLAVKAL